MNKENFVNWDSVNTEFVRFYTRFPAWVPTNKLVVNRSKIERMMQIGGISHFYVVGNNNSERSIVTPIINNFNSQGIATATYETTKEEIDLEKNASTKTNEDLMHRNRWIKTVCMINNNELTQRIQNNDKSLKSEDAWANLLDQAIKHSLICSGINHLIYDTPKLELLAVSSWYGIAAALSTAILGLGAYYHPETASFDILSILKGTLYIYAGQNLADVIFGNHKYDFYISGKQFSRRATLFHGFPEYDRAAILRLYGNMGRIVKAVK